MSQITQLGQLNTAALAVPDLYVQIVPPQQQLINGVPTNVLGIIGTAPWGPVNSPVTAGNESQGTAVFGPRQNRLNDLITAVAVAQQQGANNFRLVRVTDGTDTAATVTVQATCLTGTSKFTGSFGNGITLALAAGTQAGTQKATIAAPGLAAEVFDNIGAGLAANALWVAIANAVNNGTTALRGPSQIMVLTAGAGVAAPIPATFQLAAGTDGAAAITSAVMLGQDILPRKGMFALRNTGASVAMLADVSDETTFPTQIVYGLAEGTYMIGTGPSGDTISNAVTNKSTVGVDSFAMKVCHGDWVQWVDSVNNVNRILSPQAFFAGELVALAPNQSSLNKQMQGIVGTQKSITNQPYSQADLQTLAQAGIDLITNPIPAGAVFGARIGHNSSSNPLTNGDNYTRMTNFLASTLNSAMGKFIGRTQVATAIGVQGTASSDAIGTLGSFLDNVQAQGLIGVQGGPPAYSIEIDQANNPAASVALGNLTAAVQVQYQSIIEKFFINLQGGTNIVIQRVGVTQVPAAN